MGDKKSIHETFWSNVEWHAKNQGIPMCVICHSRTKLAREHKANITLKREQEIAELLGIDDYAILFES